MMCREHPFDNVLFNSGLTTLTPAVDQPLNCGHIKMRAVTVIALLNIGSIVPIVELIPRSVFCCT
jgi:hypothetical protein